MMIRMARFARPFKTKTSSMNTIRGRKGGWGAHYQSNGYRQNNLWSLLNKPRKECGKLLWTLPGSLTLCGWVCSITFDRINYWVWAKLIPSPIYLSIHPLTWLLLLLLLYLYVNHCVQVSRERGTNIYNRFSPLDLSMPLLRGGWRDGQTTELCIPAGLDWPSVNSGGLV